MERWRAKVNLLGRILKNTKLNYLSKEKMKQKRIIKQEKKQLIRRQWMRKDLKIENILTVSQCSGCIKVTRKMIKMDAYTIRARSFMRVIFKKVSELVKEKFCFQTDVNMKETSILVVS